MTRILISLALIFSTLLGLAQKPFYRNFTVEDGLVSSTVYSIHQDMNGFIWFTTESGVSKFDGIFFENYGREDGLGDNEIFSIFEDSQNRLWFFPFNGRLSYFHEGKLFNALNDTLLDRLEINSIFEKPFEDHQGCLWIGTTRDKKIAYYSPAGKSILFKAPHKNIQIHEVGDTYIEFASKGKLLRYALEWENELPSLGALLEEGLAKSDATANPSIEGYQISDYLVDRE